MLKRFLPFALVLLLAACDMPNQGMNISANSAVSSSATDSASAGAQKTRIWLNNFFN